MECVCCRINGRSIAVRGLENPGQVEIHHLNLGGHAGQKRLGDEFTIPLCRWHHQGVVPPGWQLKEAQSYLGPALSRQSKAFRKLYGTDEFLLGLVNQKLEEMV